MNSVKWLKERTTLNHDWLQNQFIIACYKMVNILNGKVGDEIFKKKFREAYLNECETNFPRIKILINTLVISMSPAQLFEEYPLKNMVIPEKNLLRELTHELWLYKYNVVGQQKSANIALKNMILSFRELHEADLNAKENIKERLMVFINDCRTLSDVISQFPSQIVT